VATDNSKKRANKKRRGRGEGSIKQRGPNCWETRVSLGYNSKGKRVRKTVYGATKAEVMQKVSELRFKLARGEAVDPSRLTLAEWLQHWLDVSRTNMAESTWEGYDELARLYVQPILGHVQLQRITPLHIEQLYAQLVKDKKSLFRCRAVGTFLSAALNQAVRQRLLATNPVRQVRKPKPRPREIRPFTDKEARRFLEALKTYRLYALFALALGSGMRQGELFGLRWCDVDLEKEELAVTRTLAQVKGKRYLKEPKSERSRRRLRLPGFVVEALRAHRERMLTECLPVEGDAPVFCTRRGTWLKRNDLTKHVFKPALKRGGLKDIRFHDLRHTHATSLLRRGKSIKAVSYRLGHASVQLTLQVYTHVLPVDDQELADTLDQVYAV
jgi:integrase